MSMILLVLCASSTHVSAHGTAENFDKPVDNGLSRVSYSPLDLVEDWLAPFRVELKDTKGEKALPYGSVWARLTKDDKTLFSGSFAPSSIDQSAAFTYFFQTTGQYVLDLRFFDDKNIVIGEASYPLDVVKDEFKPFDYRTLLWPAVSVIIGVVIGVGLAFVKRNATR